MLQICKIPGRRSMLVIDARHSFITGYWIWNKILENLATIGYDPVGSP